MDSDSIGEKSSPAFRTGRQLLDVGLPNGVEGAVELGAVGVGAVIEGVFFGGVTLGLLGLATSLLFQGLDGIVFLTTLRLVKPERGLAKVLPARRALCLALDLRFGLRGLQ